MRRIYFSLFALMALAGTAWAGANFFNPTGTFSQVYAVLYGQDGAGNFNPVIVGPGGGISVGGSTGLDFSANKPSPPNIGSGFSGGPYAGYVLIATVPASSTRAYVDVENNSAAQIAIERDDGTAASGAAPVNASVFPISNGAGTGQQGGSWTSSTFKGRLQIFAPSSSAQVAVMVD